MRYLILSDIHANLEAFEAVLDDVSQAPYDRTVVLGDLVGYGADPNAVIARVQALAPHILIRGNHDKVASGIEEPEGFNAMARQAARWTFDTLTPDHRAYLAALPAGPKLLDAVGEVCHGAPQDEDAYIFEEFDAIEAFGGMRRDVCLYGHTHVPVIFSLAGDQLDVQIPSPDEETTLVLAPNRRYLINPGSIGQPRDGDPRASYALVDGDDRTVRLRRVSYPIETTQQKIREAGLPDSLAQRLALGR